MELIHEEWPFYISKTSIIYSKRTPIPPCYSEDAIAQRCRKAFPYCLDSCIPKTPHERRREILRHQSSAIRHQTRLSSGTELREDQKGTDGRATPFISSDLRRRSPDSIEESHVPRPCRLTPPVSHTTLSAYPLNENVQAHL
jgi:hypothetical protein